MGKFGGIQVSIELYEDRQYVTNGDIIRGRVLIVSTKSFDARNVEIKMRCEDYAEVLVPDAQGCHTEIETLRYLSLKNTLFPDQSIRYGSTTDPNARYTLQSGKHGFDFEFQVPLANQYPQSINIQGTPSGVRWYLKATVYRGQVFSKAKKYYHRFEMRPMFSNYHNYSHLSNHISEHQMTVFLSGFADACKTASGRFKSMMPGNTKFKKQTSVTLALSLPTEGVPQSPFSLNALLDISSPEGELITVKHFEISLKRRTIVFVQGYNSDWKESYTLLDLRNIDSPLKAAIAKIQDAIDKTHIKDRIPSTFANIHFQVSYRMVVAATLACKEKPGALERIRTSVPIDVHPFMPLSNFQPIFNKNEELPLYNEHALVGESTLIAK